ncbi:MAG: hypothetical protein AAF975_02020 [Spirochaetota bacterium]
MLSPKIEQGPREVCRPDATPSVPPEIKIVRSVFFDAFDSEGRKIENVTIRRRACWLMVQEGRVLGKAPTKRLALEAAEDLYFGTDGGRV